MQPSGKRLKAPTADDPTRAGSAKRHSSVVALKTGEIEEIGSVELADAAIEVSRCTRS